jgi:hypothetical protein
MEQASNMYNAELASKLSQFGKTEIEYNLLDLDNARPPRRIVLKFNSLNPPSEEIDLKLNEAIKNEEIIYQESIIIPPQINYYEILKNVLDANIADGTYDVVRTVLKDLDGEKVILNNRITMDITANSLEPEDINLSIKGRIDAELGDGTFDKIKQVLKLMGFNDIKILRESNIIL